MNGPIGKLNFQEIQRFRQASLWGLLGTIVLVVTALLGGWLFGQVILDRRGADGLQVLLAVLGFFTVIALVWIMYAAQLITEVRTSGLYVKFHPFHWSFQKIDLRNFTRVEVVTYSPLRDYGGWGIRYGPAGKAYNVHGNRGVRLIARLGRNLMIGSQKPEELAAALEPILHR